MNLARIHRLLKIISLLQAGKGFNADHLAVECGVSRRTVFRDLDVLRQSGVPLTYDEQGQRYRIPGACYLPPTNFTAEEALSLIVLCHEMGAGDALPFFGPARSAAIKLESALPARLRDQVRQVAEAVEIQTTPRNPLLGQASVYEQLLEAIARRRCVRIRYHSLAESEVICTRLSPYRLLFSRRSWYVIGRSSLHRATRTFNLGRVQHIEPTDDRYQIPRGFSIDRYLRNAWHLIPEPGPDHDVLVRFSPMVAQNVAEVAWHKTQALRFNPDGTLDFRATVSGLNEISWWILGYGDQAEALEPPELRSLVSERAGRTAALYQRAPPPAC
jgi:predicted DNA-binding transcriptional regulator YafY